MSEQQTATIKPAWKEIRSDLDAPARDYDFVFFGWKGQLLHHLNEDAAETGTRYYIVVGDGEDRWLVWQCLPEEYAATV